MFVATVSMSASVDEPVLVPMFIMARSGFTPAPLETLNTVLYMLTQASGSQFPAWELERPALLIVRPGVLYTGSTRDSATTAVVVNVMVCAVFANPVRDSLRHGELAGIVQSTTAPPSML